jgi:MoxR-like ATPase
MEKIKIENISLSLANCDELNLRWIGQPDMLYQLLACWHVEQEGDYPLNPRLTGKPGVGKTTLAYTAASMLNRPVYLFQATMDTRPEDLIITPVIGEGNSINYVASPLVSAMIKGGVCIIDEGNRMSEKAWASLAPLLDTRRYVESIIAGVKINAHPDFRVCVTMNEDSSTYELPEYIHSRLQPQIYIDFPDRDEELLILKYNLSAAPERALNYIVDFLQRSHAADERYTVRDGINIGRYALKIINSGYKSAILDKSEFKAGGELDAAIKSAVKMVIGIEGLIYCGQ